MSDSITPESVIQRLLALFESSGLELLGLDRAGALFGTEANAGDLANWSRYFQRLYRYHDFCALELADAVGEETTGAVHLWVETRRHEALAGAYRLAGMAVDAIRPDITQALPPAPVLIDEFDAVAASLLVVAWAFATRAQRQALLDALPSDKRPEATDELLAAVVDAVLEPMGEAAFTLENMASALPPGGLALLDPVYPPLHPAAQYHGAVDEALADLKTLHKRGR